MSLYLPENTEELSELIAGSKGTVDFQPGSQAAWRGKFEADIELSTQNMSGIVEWSPEDQVVVVKAGTMLKDLNEELASKGQVAAPFLCPFAENASVGGAYSMNLPALASHQWGDWRTWTLGIRGVRANGKIVKSGSKAVKSVAGYDAHAFLAGTRGTFLLISELTLRLYPLEIIEKYQKNILRQEGRRGECTVIQKVLPSELQKALETIRGYEAIAQPVTGTLWAWVDQDTELAVFPGQSLLSARPRALYHDLTVNKPFLPEHEPLEKVPDSSHRAATHHGFLAMNLALDSDQRFCKYAFSIC